jgi:ketosteroid isomerase-like protein
VSDQANVAVVTSIYDAFSKGDIAGILNYLDPQAELIFEGSPAVPWSGNRRGHDGWLAFFQAVGQNLNGVTFTEAMQPFAVQADHVVFAGRYGGRVKATGTEIDSPLVHLWTLRNGKVVRCLEMTNTAAEVVACSPGAAA